MLAAAALRRVHDGHGIENEIAPNNARASHEYRRSHVCLMYHGKAQCVWRGNAGGGVPNVVIDKQFEEGAWMLRVACSKWVCWVCIDRICDRRRRARRRGKGFPLYKFIYFYCLCCDYTYLHRHCRCDWYVNFRQLCTFILQFTHIRRIKDFNAFHFLGLHREHMSSTQSCT